MEVALVAVSLEGPVLVRCPRQHVVKLVADASEDQVHGILELLVRIGTVSELLGERLDLLL